MIPIIWRFFISQYIKVTFLCVISFIAVMLIMRLDDIAHFASLGGSWSFIGMFILLQIPYILPIVIPIGCLISSILLVQRLSQTHELTALRACGLAIRNFLAPVMITASLLSILNFYVVSELATYSHFMTNAWKMELRAVNPLLLLQNRHMMRMKGAYFHAMGNTHRGEFAEEVVMAIPNKKQGRIHLFLAEEVHSDHNAFVGKGVSFISATDSSQEEDFDTFLIENAREFHVHSQDFSQLVEGKVWNVNTDHLPMPLLLSRLQQEKEDYHLAQSQQALVSDQKVIKRGIYRCYTEIFRRFSVALAPLTFTLLGMAFGISISRNRSNRGIFVVIALASLYLFGYFIAKGIDHLIISSSIIYFVPHVIIIFLSLWVLRRIARGVE